MASPETTMRAKENDVEREMCVLNYYKSMTMAGRGGGVKCHKIFTLPTGKDDKVA
jgi:hypothetical protein